jgi:valyl-tRNA synthetase
VWWSCTLKTAISAIEVEYKELTGPTKLNVPGYDKKIEFGVIHSFAYKVDDGSGDEIIVATTRLETMLGDVCVCVHPEDPRYTKYIGKTLKHPFIAGRVVTVIPDAILVDMNFGSGAVKVTPAHDPNDYKTGKRHDLQFISLFDDAGNMNANCGQFTGMKRFDCRYAIIDELTKMGLYRGKATNPMSLGFCSRSKDVVEQVIRPQWWVSCEGMVSASPFLLFSPLFLLSSPPSSFLPHRPPRPFSGQARGGCRAQQGPAHHA